MKYSFPQFRTEIVDPTIQVVSVNDNLTSMTCSVDIVMTSKSNDKFGHTFSGFDYTSKGTWEDSDIYDFVIDQMVEFEIGEKSARSMEFSEEPSAAEPMQNTFIKPKKKSLWKRFIKWLKSLFK